MFFVFWRKKNRTKNLKFVETGTVTYIFFIRGHSNNMWHFFSLFLTPPAPLCHFVTRVGTSPPPPGVMWHFNFSKNNVLKTLENSTNFKNRAQNFWKKMPRDTLANSLSPPCVIWWHCAMHTYGQTQLQRTAWGLTTFVCYICAWD